MHTLILLTAGLAMLYIIRRDLTSFNHEVRAHKWDVDGRRSLLEAWQDYRTKRELRRHLRTAYRAKRRETVEELGL